jgi:hypothetical protein
MLRFLVVAALILTGFPSVAATFDDPGWPCIQRKVPVLSAGQMWAGPQVTGEAIKLGRSPVISALASKLALRRVSLEEAEVMIAEFADGLQDGHNSQITALFSRVFDIINDHRTRLISGIGRYAKKQAGLSEGIEQRRDAIGELEAAGEPDLDRIEELQDFLTWDERIFKERSQSLAYVCETPVILEQRLFALARIMQSHLSE